MEHIYTGIGSRAAPKAVCAWAYELGLALGQQGWMLRSGAADGLDNAFERGAVAAKASTELYVPWKGYNGSASHRHMPTKEAFNLAQEVHPAWEALGSAVRKMHACSAHQVLGERLTQPSKFCICWTPDGCESERTRTRQTGGTATGIVIAERNAVPVFNLYNDRARQALNQLLRQLNVAYQVPCNPAVPQQTDLF